MKAAASVLYTIILILLMFFIIFNCNALSLILFLSIAFTCYKNFSYTSLIYINMILVVVYIIQYGMALSNLSSKNSPMTFPDPFTEYEYLKDLTIPWYKHIDFFSYFDGDSYEPNSWAFYCSLMVSYARVKNLWFGG